MNQLEAKKHLLSCPGDTIQETIDEIDMTQAELAERMGRSVPKLNELIKGKAPITRESASKLEYVLGIAANFWLNLEQQYQEEKRKIEQLEFLEESKEWLKGFPLPALKKAGVLPDTRKKSVLIEHLLKFFRVASPREWKKIYEGNSLAFKIELKYTNDPKAISTWLRLGEIQAEQLRLSKFDKKKIRVKLDTIQKLSYKKPENWMQQLQVTCADCGIALVYTPCISKAPIYGATRWIKNNTPLLQITDRQKDYNAFWFTFYHELGHILYHGKTDIFIEGLEDIQQDKEKEEEADKFARRMLLSEKQRNDLFMHPQFYPELILELSEEYKVHPGIIVAQVQRKFNKLYKHKGLNQFKVKVEFEEINIKSIV